MQFRDLFTRYKVERKIKGKKIPFKELPVHKKVSLVFICVLTLIGLVFFVLSEVMIHLKYEKITALSTVIYSVSMVLLFIVIATEFHLNKADVESTLKTNNYTPYSKIRMDCIVNVLKAYNINIKDTNQIDLLIEEAKLAQSEYDSLNFLRKPSNAVPVVLTSTITLFVSELIDGMEKTELINYAIHFIVLIIAVYALLALLYYTLREFSFAILKDYKLYDEFIYDLRQIKIFPIDNENEVKEKIVNSKESLTIAETNAKLKSDETQTGLEQKD